MAQFNFTRRRLEAAALLAQGYTTNEVSKRIGVGMRSIQRWKNDSDFSAEVDRLSCMIGVANKAYRLRIVNRVVRQKVIEGETIKTNKDLLDWLKHAQTETDGIKLDLTPILDDLLSPVAGSEQSGDTTDSGEEDGDDDNHTGAG